MTFKFDFKATRAYGEQMKVKAETIANNVAPSPFNVDVETVQREVSIYLQDLNREYKAVVTKTGGRRYSITNDMLYELFSVWGKTNLNSLFLVGYIGTKLKYNSNYVELLEEEFCTATKVSPRTFYNAMDALVRSESNTPVAGDCTKLLAKTTKRGIYVVNHNLIFKGNFDFFLEVLKEKYPNGCELDSKGRVILNH